RFASLDDEHRVFIQLFSQDEKRDPAIFCFEELQQVLHWCVGSVVKREGDHFLICFDLVDHGNLLCIHQIAGEGEQEEWENGRANQCVEHEMSRLWVRYDLEDSGSPFRDV